MLSGLSKYCGVNLGGVILLEYAPLILVDKSSYVPIYSSGNLLYNILFLEGGEWLSAPVLSGSTRWAEGENRNDQGSYYEQRLTGIVPKMRPEASSELELMSEYQYLIRLNDKNGKTWLLGTPDHPFYFQSDGTSGDGTGLNDYGIRFFSDTPWRAKGFVPTFQI